MASYQRRGSAGRTRFLLALSLSTLTALGVAAPLALQAAKADESTLALNDPVASAYDESGEDLLDSPGARSLRNDSDSSIGGISQRPAVKGQAQTSKTESDPADAVTAPSTDGPALTNPEPTTTTAAEVETTVPAPTTTTANESSTTGPTTTIGTSTTDPDPTTSSSSTTVGSSSTTVASSTTTENPGGSVTSSTSAG